MKINANDLRVFVPNGDSGRDTAVLLIGSAKDAEVDTKSVQKVSGGYLVPFDLVEYLVDEGVIYDPDDEDFDAADEPGDEDEEEQDEPYLPADHTVEDVKAYVEANPDALDAVILSEGAGKNRTTLMDWLHERQAETNASGNRAEENQAQDKE